MFSLKASLQSGTRLGLAKVCGRRLLRTNNLIDDIKIGFRSMSNQPTQFDGETAELYSRIFKLHYHNDGPWKMMVEATEKAIGSNEKPKILDLATGPGEPGTLLSKRFPQGDILLTDISPDMVEKAKEMISMSGVQNARVKIMDAQDLIGIDNDSIDVVTCCYGFMFCPEPEKAFAEVQRVLKPGGVLVGTVWVAMPFMMMLRNIMQAVLGKPPPPPPINPMSMAEQGVFEGLVEGPGGMKIINSRESEYPFSFGGEAGDSPDMDFKMTTLPVASVLKELAEKEIPSAFEIAKESFEKELATELYGEKKSNGEIVTKPNRFKMIVAQKL